MVGKVTSGSSFSGLSDYLTGKPERVAWTEPRWLLGTDPKEIAREMEAAAGQSSRIEKPVYHLSISFGAGDHPTREQMREAAERVLDRLGLSEHQAFLVAHNDTDHPHVHIMVNRVHPETGKAWQTSHDYARIEQVLRSLEKEWGLTPVPGHHAREEGAPAPDRTVSRQTGEIRQIRRTGEAPFPDVVRARVGKDIAQAKSWAELMGALEQHGLRVEARGRGAVITDGRHYAKASSVDREASLPRLERRFGQTLRGYLADDRAPTPHRGLTGAAGGNAGADDKDKSHPADGAHGTTLNASGVLGALRGLRRLQEEPEKEVPERVGRLTLQAAEALLRSDPAMREVVRDVHAYGKARETEAALQKALQGYHEADRALKRLPDLERRAAELRTPFERELARAYRDPERARAAFEKLAAKEGVGPAAERMSRSPETFGDLRETKKRAWLGLARHVDEAPARSAARTASDLGAQYLNAKAQLPSAAQVEKWTASYHAAAAEVARLKQELGTGPLSGNILQRIGERAQKLSPQQMNGLQHVLMPKQFQMVAQAVSKTAAMIKGLSR